MPIPPTEITSDDGRLFVFWFAPSDAWVACTTDREDIETRLISRERAAKRRQERFGHLGQLALEGES